MKLFALALYQRSMRWFHVLLAALAVAGAGCAVAPTSEAGSWVGTITTEGDVTTVVSESGSVWGGTARLVEEASIGVEAGAEEYQFGSIGSLYATDDRIYVADEQVPAVRAYDHDGRFVVAFGGRGEGPGEYSYPGPVAADASGRVFVHDPRHTRINVYTAGGDVLAPWPMSLTVCCGWPMHRLPGDAVWVALMVDVPGPGNVVMSGAQAIGPAGALGEPLWLPEIEYERATYETPSGREDLAPFSPYLSWAPTPDGRLVVGTSDRYRFEVRGQRGAELVVERHWEPVRVWAEHKEWERRLKIAFERDINRAEVSLSPSQIPDHMPAFYRLIPALSGETWVVRQGESERLADCAGDPLEVGWRTAWERPCWASQPILDVFGADGRYLGEVSAPEGLAAFAGRPFIDGRRVIAEYHDADDTIMVKRYRLVLPGEETG